MSDLRGRRDAQATRPRPRPAAKPDAPSGFGQDILDDERPAAPPHDTPDGEPEHIGFDAETNSRYEEIKRGTTHISELQQMTMAQLQKVARDEQLTDYSGLKKQDLIFKILKERVAERPHV